MFAIGIRAAGERSWRDLRVTCVSLGRVGGRVRVMEDPVSWQGPGPPDTIYELVAQASCLWMVDAGEEIADIL